MQKHAKGLLAHRPDDFAGVGDGGQQRAGGIRFPAALVLETRGIQVALARLVSVLRNNNLASAENTGKLAEKGIPLPLPGRVENQV